MQRHNDALRMDALPQELYRFRTFAAEGRNGADVQSVYELLAGRLRFAPISSFNDPFEARPQYVPAFQNPAEQRAALIDYVAGILPSGGSKTSLRKQAAELIRAKSLQQLIEEFSEAGVRAMLREGVQVLCMSGPEAVATPLAWSHYADAHRGVCVHLDTRIAPMSMALKVEYGSDYPSVPIPRTAINNDELLRNLVLRKCELWAYEHEYRVARLNMPHAGLAQHLTVQWEGTTAQAARSAAIGITLGAMMPDGRQDELLRWIRANRPDLQVWRAKLHPSQYTIVRERIM